MDRIPFNCGARVRGRFSGELGTIVAMNLVSNQRTVFWDTFGYASTTDTTNLIELNRIETQIVITLGYASQTHWITIVREYIYWGENGLDTDWAECLFSFWKHRFYKKGGVGPIPRKEK